MNTSSRIKEFVGYFGPVLDALRALGGSGTRNEVADKVAEMLQISQKQQQELRASGQPVFLSSIGWTRFYLSKDGFISSSERGVWALTDKGSSKRLSEEEAFKIYQRLNKTFREQRRLAKLAQPETEEADETEADVPTSYREELLKLIKSLSPSGFERLCQRLLREADFTQVTVTGSSGDGGIDGLGILQLNPFVSFQVRFQCKRYDGSVGSSQIRDFRGAMEGRADKGIIITTGSFTADARKEALRDGARPIELVDGQKLIEMFEHLQLGLKPIKTFEVDADFFDDFREDLDNEPAAKAAAKK
jgi:restriction system protein